MVALTRTTITLAVLAALVLIGAVLGWTQLTKPFPGKADAAVCVPRTVSAGSRIYPQDVTVSVLNAGDREGLAGRTMASLAQGGFSAGSLANAPAGTEVSFAQIWTTDPGSPAVRLVASKLGPRADVVRRDATAAGVVVVVGDRFEDLAKGRPWVTATQDTAICTQPIA